jgi:hypothetical protein
MASFPGNTPKRRSTGSDVVYKDLNFADKRNQTNIIRLVKNYLGLCFRLSGRRLSVRSARFQIGLLLLSHEALCRLIHLFLLPCFFFPLLAEIEHGFSHFEAPVFLLLSFTKSRITNMREIKKPPGL